METVPDVDDAHEGKPCRGLEQEVEALYQPKVDLPNGASIVIDQAEALVAARGSGTALPLWSDARARERAEGFGVPAAVVRGAVPRGACAREGAAVSGCRGASATAGALSVCTT